MCVFVCERERERERGMEFTGPGPFPNVLSLKNTQRLSVLTTATSSVVYYNFFQRFFKPQTFDCFQDKTRNIKI